MRTHQHDSGGERAEKLQIRLLQNVDEIAAIQQLEKDIWNMDPIPVHQTYTAAKNGGIILGLYDGERLVGFNYGFPGYKYGRSYLCSHMMGILHDYQGQGWGERLKWEQRRHALKRGYTYIQWTYDPLESVNAYLNLHKLGAVSSTYIPDCYGEMKDELNRGLPTDRFQVEWWIESEHIANNPRDSREWTMAVTLIEPIVAKKEDAVLKPASASFTDSDQRIPALPDFGIADIRTRIASCAAEEKPCTIPIPVGFQTLKKTDPELALEWRLKTRTLFQECFAQGYEATDVKLVQSVEKGTPRVACYLLQKKNRLHLPRQAIE